MSTCSNKPVKLNISTTDNALFLTDHFTWGGAIYVAIECYSRSFSYDSNAVPNIKAEKYRKMDKIPFEWNFCDSFGCSGESDMFLVVFTFNPSSTKPEDFLQYFIDINCRVLGQPSKSISDSMGKPVYFNIDVNNDPTNKYVDFWISMSTPFGYLSYKTTIKTWAIFLILSLIVLGVLGVLGYLYRERIMEMWRNKF